MGGELLEEVLWGQLACRSAASADNLHAELRNKGLNSPSYCAKRHVSVLLRIVVEGWRAARSRSWGEAAAAPLLSVADSAEWCSGNGGDGRSGSSAMRANAVNQQNKSSTCASVKMLSTPGTLPALRSMLRAPPWNNETTRGEQSKPKRKPRGGWPLQDVRNQREGTHHELGLVFIRYGRSG